MDYLDKIDKIIDKLKVTSLLLNQIKENQVLHNLIVVEVNELNKFCRSIGLIIR